jgi:gluconokinase
MVVILMGVTGAGKTTVGRALAGQLQWKFVDADDYHSAVNVAKMRSGIPLTDIDRIPWLAALRTAIQGWLAARENVVLACSALKSSYRQVLIRSPEIKLVYLRADRKLIAERLAERENHYMSPQLIDSQFATLQEPADAVKIDAALSTPDAILKIRQALGI